MDPIPGARIGQFSFSEDAQEEQWISAAREGIPSRKLLPAVVERELAESALRTSRSTLFVPSHSKPGYRTFWLVWTVVGKTAGICSKGRSRSSWNCFFRLETYSRMVTARIPMAIEIHATDQNNAGIPVAFAMF